MNSIDKNPNYKQLYQIVRDEFQKKEFLCTATLDETFFTMRVFESAKRIIKELKNKDSSIKIKEQQVLVATIFHDIGKIKLDPVKLFGKKGFTKTFRSEWHKHPKLSAPITKDILNHLGYSIEFIDEVLYLVENHSMRGNKMQNRSIELSIMQDADLISDVGFAGFMRPFIYGGRFARGIIETIRFIEQEDRTNGGNELNLDVSKEIGKKEVLIKNKLLKHILKELDSELLD